MICVTSITLNRSTLPLTQGNSFTLTATVCPTNADNKSVIWSSGNTAVATVTSSGLVLAQSAGTTSITATAAGGCAVTVTCVVTVTACCIAICGPTMVYQSSLLPGLTSDLSTAPDLLINDKTKDQIKSLQSNYTQYATAYDNSGLAALKQNLYDLVDEGTLDNEYMNLAASQLFDHFLDGTGTDYNNQILELYVFCDPSTINYVNVAKQAITNYIKTHLGDPTGVFYDDTTYKAIDEARLYSIVQMI